MTTTQHPALPRAQLESMRSLLTECHDYLKPVHDQFMRAEKHEEAIHRVGSELFKRISCALDGQVEPECGCCGHAAECDSDCVARQADPAPANDELIVYRALNKFGGDCHFGVESLARVWASTNGSVERVTLKPVPELSVVSTRSAQHGNLPWTDSMIREFVSVALRHVDVKGTLHAQDIRDALKHMADRYPAPNAPTTPQPKHSGLVEMIDAAMIEMRNIAPPLRRSDCERLIRAAMAAKEV